MKDVIEKAVRLVENAFDQRAVKVTRSRISQVRFSRNKIDITLDYDDVSIYVFLAKSVDGKRKTLEFIASTPEEMVQKIEAATGLIEKLPPNPRFVTLAQERYTYPKPRYDERLLEIDLKASVEQAIEAALEAGAKRVAGTLYVYNHETYLKTTFNEGHDRNVYAALSVRAFIDKTTSGHRVNAVSKRDDFDPEATGRLAGELAKLGAKERIKVEPGKYTLIAGPLMTANFTGVLGRMSSIAAVEFGFSALRPELLGKQIASEGFTLISSARKDYIGYRLFDDEGVPVKEVKVIDRGTFKTHLHSTSTAKRYNTESTGNAGILEPHPRQLIIEPGDATFEEMIEETKRGLFVSNVWYTRFQSYVTGDFSTIPRDTMLYVENGEIKGSVRGLRVNGNVLQRLKNVRMIGKELYPIYRREAEIPSVVPHLLIEDVQFTEAHRVFSFTL